MAVISDIAGTSNESFSINGRSLDKGVTLYQGDVEPDRLVGNDGDVYFKKEGLIYIKRNGVWLSHGLNLDVRDQYESLKWLPDPRSYNKFLIYSNGDNYTIANNLKFNENDDNCLRLESSLPNNADSKYVPNIEWVNDRIIHKKLTQEIGDNIENTYNENYEDKVGNIVAYQNVKINDPNNSSKMTFSTKSKNNTEAKIELIAEDNISYAKAPTPPSYATGNEIATIEWISHNTSSKKLGEIVWLSVPTDDNGLKLLNGQRLSKIGYEDFWNHLKTLYNRGFTYIHYENNDNTSINRDNSQKGHYFINNSYIWLPDWSNIVVISPTSNDNEVGEHKEAGVPNIEGWFASPDDILPPAEGAFYTNNTRAGYNCTDGGGSGQKVYFDASQSNSIYGNSNTVQPEAIKYYAYVVVLTNINGDVAQLDIDELVDEITEFKNNSIGYPDYTAGVSISSGTTLTNNGWLRARHHETWNAWINYDNITIYSQTWGGGDYGYQYQESYIPVKKGGNITFGNVEIIFYPCVGD